MDLLARREHSSVELRRKLIAKGFESPLVDEALSALQGEGLQSDDRFSESYIKMRVGRGYGPLRIEVELRERGITDEMGHDYLNGYHWFELATDVRAKRFGAKIPEDFAARAKQMRFLQYRGFTSDQIKQAIRGVVDEYEPA